MSDIYTTRNTCRGCGSVLGGSLLNLGEICLNDFPKEPTLPGCLPTAPLDVVQCQNCLLVQLRHSVDPNLQFREQYWYRSSVNETMRAELHDVVERALGVRIETAQTSAKIVVDIGANDGTLLSNYQKGFHTRVAIEPCVKFILPLREVADLVFTDYFPGEAREYRSLKGKADIVTAIAMCYDLEDPTRFFRGIADLLAPGGVAVIQFQDLLQTIERTAFDTMCHEHLEYYSLTSLLPILMGAGLVCVEVEHRAINGGSLRCYLKRGVATLSPVPVVAGQVEQERRRLTPVKLQDFVWRVGEVRTHLHAIIAHAARQGPVDLYAASTKANSLLQLCGIDASLIRHAVERSPEKIGRYTVATNIPIVSEDVWRTDPPPLTLVGAWQFREAFMEREAAYLQQGGAFLFPLPSVDFVTQGGRG